MLTSACGAGQGRRWVNYTVWAGECPAELKYIGYPMELPKGVAIPGWAMLNVSEMVDQTFDPVTAKAGECLRVCHEYLGLRNT